MRKILILGASGSGKTQTTRRLLSHSPLPTYVLNDRDGQHAGCKQLAEFEQVLELRDCNVVVEDLIDCSPSQLSVLQNLCNYNARHQGIAEVILIAHGITKNGIASLLEYLSHVLFMNSPSTVRSLSYVLAQYKFEKARRAEMEERFLRESSSDPHGHWVLDVGRRTFERSRSRGESPNATSVDRGRPSPSPRREEVLRDARRTAETYIPQFCRDGKRAMLLFDFVLSSLGDAASLLSGLDRASLELRLRGGSSGRVRRLSLIDYVDTLTSDRPPSADVLSLHEYLVEKEGLSLPRCFVSNADARLHKRPN